MISQDLGQDLSSIAGMSRANLTFMKAHSFCAASLDMYIHEADFRFPM